MQTTYFEFREANSKEELRELLQLRYRIYRNSRLSDFCKENPYEIDIDCYDLHGLHLGLFKIDSNRSIAVGFHRPVGDFESPLALEVCDIAMECPGMLSVATAIPSKPLPIMQYWHEHEILERAYDAVFSRGGQMAEATKFGIEPSVSSFSLARHVIECEIAIQVLINGFSPIMACNATHARFYYRYGFHQLEGTHDSDVKGVHGIALIASEDSIPGSVRLRLEQMAEVYNRTGRICYNPNNTDCFESPAQQENVFAVAA